MTTSAWSPLRKSLFRDRWIASIVSNIGGWMDDFSHHLSPVGGTDANSRNFAGATAKPF